MIDKEGGENLPKINDVELSPQISEGDLRGLELAEKLLLAAF